MTVIYSHVSLEYSLQIPIVYNNPSEFLKIPQTPPPLPSSCPGGKIGCKNMSYDGQGIEDINVDGRKLETFSEAAVKRFIAVETQKP